MRTATRTHDIVSELIGGFRCAYPGISHETAVQCLLVMTDVRAESRLSGPEALALFQERVRRAEGRGEAWAAEVRRSIDRAGRGLT